MNENSVPTKSIMMVALDGKPINLDLQQFIQSSIDGLMEKSDIHPLLGGQVTQERLSKVSRSYFDFVKKQIGSSDTSEIMIGTSVSDGIFDALNNFIIPLTQLAKMKNGQADENRADNGDELVVSLN